MRKHVYACVCVRACLHTCVHAITDARMRRGRTRIDSKTSARQVSMEVHGTAEPLGVGHVYFQGACAHCAVAGHSAETALRHGLFDGLRGNR